MMTHRRSELSALLKVLVAVIVWGASFIATKIALREVSPLAVIWLRFGIGIAVLALFLVRRREFAPVRPGELGTFALLGFIGISFHQWLQANGLLTAGAVTTAWIVSTTPVFIAMLAWLVLKERVHVAQILGIAAAAAGVLLVVGGGDPGAVIRGEFGTPGDLLILISAPNWAVFSVLSRRALQRHPPARALFYVILSGWLIVTGAFLAGGNPGEIGNLTAKGWASILFLGVFCSGLAYVFWYDALKLIPAARVGSLLYLEPLVAVAVAAVVLDERMAAGAAAGSALILTGVWLVNRGRK